MRTPSLLVVVLFGGLSQVAAAAEPAPIDFAHDVLPILKTHCAECHTDGTYKGAFSMDTRNMLLDAGVVEPGDPAASDLIDRVTSDETDYKMPPQGERLSEKEVATLRQWIKEDLPWTDGFTFRSAAAAGPLALRKVDVPPATADSGDHPIDRLLAHYAREQNVTLSEPADDETFLRRLHLDLLGLLPTPAERSQFLSNTDPDKRAQAVEAALARNRDYAAHWMTFWNDLLRNDYVGTGYIDGGRTQITKWLYASLYENKPYDAFVSELIAPTPPSEGFAKGIVWRGRVNASQKPPLQFAQNVGQVFLGVNLKCASCHDSFIDEWKLADAYGLAAVVSDEPLELHRCDTPQGKMAEPKFLFPELGTIDPDLPREERQQRLAALITDEQNGRLVRTIANRLWRELMGRGLIEPVDAMAARAWNTDLLEYLAGYLAANDYDLKKLMAHIATSRAYQSRTVAHEEPPTAEGYVFTGPVARRMTAEEFLDAVWMLTATGPEKAKADIGVPQEELTDDVAGPPVRAAFVISDPLMRSLGRPNREQVVTTRPDQLTTLQALDLSNGPLLAEMLSQGAERLLAEHEGQPAKTLVADLFRTALGRDASAQEQLLALDLAGTPPTKQGLADLLWAIVLLPEFQHVR